MLRQRGEYVLNYQGEDVVFKFNTYAFLKFCEINGNLTYQEMLDLLVNRMSIKTIAQLLMCAANKGLGIEETACSWIDALGGITGKELVEVLNCATDALIDKGIVDDGKKKAVVQENP